MLPLEMTVCFRSTGVRSVAFRTIFIFHLMPLRVMVAQVVEPIKRDFANWAFIFVRRVVFRSFLGTFFVVADAVAVGNAVIDILVDTFLFIVIVFGVTVVAHFVTVSIGWHIVYPFCARLNSAMTLR